ncbi:hypothetical protein Tco_1317419 [Tanacetum coccineum]
MTITRSVMTPEAIEELINQRVGEVLAAYEANRAAELSVESQSQNGDDDDNGNIRGNGNGNGGGIETETKEEIETKTEEAMGMEIPIGMIEMLCMLPGYVVKSVENKRRLDNNQKDNRVQQPPYKRLNVGGHSVARAYTAGNNEKRGYDGPLPY